MLQTPSPSARPTAPRGAGLLARWRWRWEHSLRFRLLSLGLMPLLVAFPLIIGVLVLVGGQRANQLLSSQLRSSLASSDNYLDQRRIDVGLRLAQLAREARLQTLAEQADDAEALARWLSAYAESSGLDYLVLARADGRVLAASTGALPGSQLPDSAVVRQARHGIAGAAYERLSPEQLASLAPRLVARASVGRERPGGLVLQGGAHLPLSVRRTDAILVGGQLINHGQALIDHMREVIFPLGSLPDGAEGISMVYLAELPVAHSHHHRPGEQEEAQPADPEIVAQVIGRGETWLGTQRIEGVPTRMGLQPLRDGDGRRIGMIAAGMPDAPYQRMTWWLLGSIAALLALAMLAMTVFFLQAERELRQRLAHITGTMTAVRGGQREARIGTPRRDDELGALSRHFDELLDTLSAQSERQREALQAAAAEASRRRALFEHERDGVLILDAQDRILEANPRCAEMLGYPVEALLRMHPGDWDARYSREEMAGLRAQLGEQGLLLETVHRRRDGSTYPAEVALSRATWGEQEFLLVLQRDITQRKSVEAELARHREGLERLVEDRTQELHQRGEQLDAIFALSPDGFVSFDAQRRVAFANRAFLRMTGLHPDEVLGLGEADFSLRLQLRSLAEARFPDVATLREEWRRARATQAEAPARVLFELASPSHRVLEVGLRLAQPGRVSQVLYFRDVTHETAVDRMKSEFLTTAAHELRTPMTSIYGYAELLRLREYPPETRADLAGTIARQSEWMLSIINELLDLARIESRHGTDFVLERLQLDELLRLTLDGFRPPEGRAAPVLLGSGQSLQVSADQQKLRQALLNLLSNAYKYSPGGGDVSIELLRHADDQGSRVGIRVTDRGIGMSPAQLARVGERFYRADASGSIPGTGLGVAIVNEIVSLHRGQLEIDSLPGEGTRATIWLPSV